MNKALVRNIIMAGLFAVPFIPFFVWGVFFFPFITTKAFLFRFIIEIIVAAWAILALISPQYRPRKTMLIYAIGIFFLIIGAADLFGMEPWKSFWSNFERMEGYVALLHLGAFFLVISSIFNENDWKRWWQTNLLASFLMVIYCAFQLGGAITINQGGARVDGTLGNASYLAVYMLVHIFIALFLWWRSKSSSRYLYLILIALQTWILYFTATRGAILGLLGGLLLTALLNVRSQIPAMRKVSFSVLGVLIILIGGFFALRNSPLVTGSPVLSRFASISTEELKSGGRAFVWPMAVEGIKEKPILGWGQDNFNYVFNEHYNPKMYNLEPWFDRAHNIFLDWGIAGGVLGLLSYLSLYVVALYLLWKSLFSYEEKAILTGLMAAYFFHNFFVFDQLISYIFFFSFLAFIHFNSLKPLSKAELKEQAEGYPVKAVLAPVLIVFLVVAYFINIKPIRANYALIKTLTHIGGDVNGKGIAADNLEKAYTLSRLGRPETVEQIAQHALPILSSQLPEERKNSFYKFARNAVVSQAEDFREDARYQIVAGAFLGQTGSLPEAAEYFKRAQTLIPGKQLVYFEYGNVLLNQNDRVGALNAFKQAYDLAPEYLEAKVVYLVGSIYAGDKNLEARLINEMGENTFLFDDRIVSAYYLNNRLTDVAKILNERIERDPANAALYKEFLQQLN
jgi:O-antigen ligase